MHNLQLQSDTRKPVRPAIADPTWDPQADRIGNQIADLVQKGGDLRPLIAEVEAVILFRRGRRGR
jgi:hypothetical protein